MSLWLQIYLWGCLVAFVELIFVYRDADGNIDWVELVVSILISALSWIVALALFISINIKHGHDKDNNDKDFFGDDNNLAGT